jgi:gliding motility-associated-like protein
VNSVYNIQSLTDYVILNSYVVCMDWLNWNTAWWRGLNYQCDKKKWRYAMWDEDATFKHYINYTGVPNLNPNASPCDPQSLNNPGGQGHIPILNSLLQNPNFKQYYVMRYFDLINTGFSCNRMLAIYDSMITVITPEMPKQINRWGGTLAEWQTNVTALRNFIAKRCDSVAIQFNNCYQVTGPFKIKVNVDPPGSGTVDFNSLTISNFLWQGTYPGNLVNYLKGKPAACYKFSHWTTKTHSLSPSMTSTAVSINLSASDSVVAHFIPTATVDATSSRTLICPGETVALTAMNASTYTWSPNISITCTNCAQTIVNPTVTTSYFVVGTYTPGCTSAKAQLITVAPKAIANFTATITQTVTLPQGVQLTNTSSQATGYLWQFINSGNSSTVTAPSFSAQTPGEYTITLIAYGANSCNDTITKMLVISDTTKFYPPPVVPQPSVTPPFVELPLPNIFTPNGDGVNDFFRPKMYGVKELSCTIFDRWGKLVYEFRDINDKWDGRNKENRESSAGTYFYVFRAVDNAGKEYLQNGWVELQR